MTPEERKAAAAVMVSEGPWDQRHRYFWCRDNASDEKWKPCSEQPAWNWHDYEYRVRPQPQYLWLNLYRMSGLGLWFHVYDTRDQADTEPGTGRIGRLKIPLEERFDE